MYPIQRPTQAEGHARCRQALLESAVKRLSCYGYGNRVLEEVATLLPPSAVPG